MFPIVPPLFLTVYEYYFVTLIVNSAFEMFSIPLINASGVKEIESIPCSTRNCENSGKSLGAWPHKPILIPAFFAAVIAPKAVEIRHQCVKATPPASACENAPLSREEYAVVD
jgi:hypothetical protein